MLDRQLRDARMQAFTGRDEELTAFRHALRHRSSAGKVIFLHGPGGIGKSTLLTRFADEAEIQGYPVVQLRPGTPADGSSAADGTVVLIDDLDSRAQSEDWLRDTLFPAYPVDTLFVVASRPGPSLTWRVELGWDEFLRPLALEPLPAAESAAILTAHGVPAERAESALAVGAGNPLALRIAAQAIRNDSQCVTDWDLYRTVALSTLPRLIGDIPSPAHRQALEVCARAAVTDENLLRAGVPGADPGELFTWLKSLPFIRSTTRGLYPDEVVRNVVEAELRWRDPDDFIATHERVKQHLIERARSVAPDVVLPLISDLFFLKWPNSTPRPVNTRLQDLELEEHPYREADLPEVRELTRRAEGEQSAEIAEFWLARQPESFYVYRRPGDHRIAAFSGHLKLRNPDADELRRDPIAAAAWTSTQRITPLRTGEHVTIARFTVDPGNYYRPGAAVDLSRMRMSAIIVCDDRLAWHVVVCPDPEFWGPTLQLVHTVDDGPPVTIGERSFTLYTKYYGSRHISAWAEEYVDRTLSRKPRTEPTAPAPDTTWDRAEFEREIRLVLRSWHRPDILTGSRLIGTRMVGEAGGDPVSGLRQVFTAALNMLRDDPRQAKYHRVLMATFIHRAATQEAAAERLSLPFSTYRRHLGRGLDALGALLWMAETGSIRLLDHEAGR